MAKFCDYQHISLILLKDSKQGMREQTEGSSQPRKRQKLPIKIESFLLKSLESQFESYHALTEQAPNSPAEQKSVNKSRLLPVISRRGRIALPPPAKEEPLFGRKQPKLSSILHYRSQKLLQAVRAKEEEEQYLYKGSRRFAIEVIKLSQQSLEKPQKQETKGRYSLPNIAQKQQKMDDLIRNKLHDGPLQASRQKLKSLAVPKKKKQLYLHVKEPETLSGWNAHQQDFEPMH